MDMTEEHSFYIDKLPEGSRIEKLSNEIKQFITSDVENLQTFLFKLFNSCYKFVPENIDPVFSPEIEINLIYQTELYEKIEREKEKIAKIREPAKRKSTAFHIGNSNKGQIFLNVDRLLSMLLKHGYPTIILNFVMIYFHEILHCCYLNLKNEQEILSIE
ncbi:MAG: hypothetical protein P8X91_00200, partial [Candidatus Bathyarchaeota archaeon]